MDIEDTIKQKKPVRSWSGVLVVTVVMKPSKFSCPFDCHYCPNEPGQPRSYLSSEPAIMRANRNHFDPIYQFNNRMDMLGKNGHSLDKIEIIVLGGTFSSYPRDYQEEFIRDIFYAANVYTNEKKRDKKDIGHEKNENENADKKIIGISLETRPDMITKRELERLRYFGCTRVQIGVQHTKNHILEYVNRGHTVEQSIKAIKLLKNAGFKVDLHIMPDLPGSSPEDDKEMIHEVLCSESFSPDYLKIYPCLDVDFTEIRKWKESGKWKPYSEEGKGQILLDVCLTAKIYSKKYIRYNRIQRDFPEEKENVLGYQSKNIRTNFRQQLQQYAKSHNVECLCIRCREIKKRSIQYPKINQEIYKSSEGIDIFISIDSFDKKVLYGFIRLRLNKINTFKELNNTALIRELHVYGFLQTTTNSSKKAQVQHKGFGTVLLAKAEIVAYKKGFNNIAIISGVGVRNFYRKRGYKLMYKTEYMHKTVTMNTYIMNCITIFKFKSYHFMMNNIITSTLINYIKLIFYYVYHKTLNFR